MQVEYESSPIAEQPSFGEGVSFRPGSPQAGGAESEEEQDEEDAEAGEGPCLFSSPSDEASFTVLEKVEYVLTTRRFQVLVLRNQLARGSSSSASRSPKSSLARPCSPSPESRRLLKLIGILIS